LTGGWPPFRRQRARNPMWTVAVQMSKRRAPARAILSGKETGATAMHLIAVNANAQWIVRHCLPLRTMTCTHLERAARN
jgi:hypothetical protein